MATPQRPPVRTFFHVGGQRISPKTFPEVAQGINDVRQSMAGIVRAFENLVNELEGLTTEAVFENAYRVYARSIHYVPKDTGKLVNSAYIEVAPPSPGRVNAVVGYAKGNDPNYATIVHEDLTKRHASPTRAKFLTTAIMDEVNNMLPHAVKRIRAPWRRAGR